MKQSPQEKRITERMQPGVYSRDGFLGDDRRPLGEILEADRSATEALGVDCERIAEGLRSLLERAAAAGGASVQIGGSLAAEFHEAMGRIPCPFGDGVHPKGEVCVRDETGRTFHLTPLSIHMIGEHGFFQGLGSRYRVSPEDCCRLLGFAPSP